MGFTAVGISTSTVTTTQQAPLGFVLTAPSSVTNGGLAEWVYVHSAAALVAGEVVMKADGDATYANLITGAAAALNIRIVGVAQHVIAAVGSSKGYGDVYDSGTAADLGGVFALASENAAATIGALMTCTIDCRG